MRLKKRDDGGHSLRNLYMMLIISIILVLLNVYLTLLDLSPFQYF